jgi:hypothetical protein
MSQEQNQRSRKDEEAPVKKHDDAEASLNDQDPGERQKENQNREKEDPLAA